MYKYFLFFFILDLIKSQNILNLINNYGGFIDYENSRNIFRSIVFNIIGEEDDFMNDLNLTNQCRDQLEESFFQYRMSMSISSYPYYKKLFFHSSLDKNDLSSYYDCINDKIDSYIGYYYIQNFTYLTLLIDDNKSLYDLLTTNSGTSSYLIGLCFIDNCSLNDYELIIKKGMEYINLYKFNNSNNYSNISNNTNINDNNNDNPEIKIYILNNNIKSKGFIKFLEILPFIIILIHIFFTIFSSIPIFIYKLILKLLYCKKLKKSSHSKNHNLIKSKQNKNKKGNNRTKSIENEKKEKSLSLKSGNDNIIKSLDLLYNITNNYSFLTEFKKQNEITNDGGLSYINGIKGISMIFFLFGCVYSGLYSSFKTEKNSENFYSQLNNIFFSIYYVGIKFAPKLLICTSGFSLFYKFICFLDGKVDNEREIMRQKEESIFGGKEIKDIKNNSSELNDSYSSFQKNSKEKLYDSYMISTKYIFIFLGLQSHKYIIYLLFTFFILYSLDWIVYLLQTDGPMWQFFNQRVINSAKNIKYLFPLFLGYKSYFIPYIRPDKENILHYFYLVFQEIIYFLITTLIIFIGFKKNLRIDIFFQITFFILISFRIIYYFIAIGLDDKDYFGLNEWGRFYTSLLYDYPFYIIGIHYGMINYVIQKGYSVKDLINKNKNYLISSSKILNASKKKNKKNLYIISFISSIFIILNIFIQQIIIYIIRIFKSSNLQLNMEVYKKDFTSQIIMLIDSDIFVIAINLIALCMYLKGDNLINNILCHSIWSILNRFYFSYILLINPIILYLLYINETKILFNISNCLFYSIICGILVFFTSIFFYIIFELPLKKLIRFWIKMNDKGVYKERLSNLEATYSYCDDDNLLDSATASITDYNDENEEEEDDEY